MAPGIHAPKIKTRRLPNGSWTAALYIEGRWHANMGGFSTEAEARREIRRKYL